VQVSRQSTHGPSSNRALTRYPWGESFAHAFAGTSLLTDDAGGAAYAASASERMANGFIVSVQVA